MYLVSWKFTHMEKLEGMILHCIVVSDFYLSYPTATHTHHMWYLATVIDCNFARTREVVHNCSTRVGVRMHVKLVFLEDDV